MNSSIESYIESLLEREPEYLYQIFRRSNIHLLNPRMQSGHYQGRLLKMLCSINSPKRVLEIGTFSAYATLCMAEGIPPEGHIDTIEINDELEDFIRENISTSPFSEKISLYIGDAMDIIPELPYQYDFVFIDGNKRLYKQYLEIVLPKLTPNGLIIADNTLWSGKVLEETHASNDYQTQAIAEFNEYVAKHSELQQIILPIRDGLTLIKKTIKNDT